MSDTYETKLGHTMPADETASAEDQPHAKREFVRKAMDLFREFANDSRLAHNKCRDNDARYYDSYRLYRERAGRVVQDGQAETCAPSYDYLADKHDEQHYPTATPALYSVCESMIADLMQAFPEPVLLGRSMGDDAIAETLSAMLRVQRERGRYRSEYRKAIKHLVRRGMAVMQCVWDGEAERGRGDVRLTEWDFLNFYPDPLYEDMQDGRAVFKLCWKHKGWFAERYPEAYPMMQCDQGIEDERHNGQTFAEGAADDTEQLPMLEYWYRKYDAKRGATVVHMAKIAGGVLLECSEDLTQDGLYAHGRYPFVLYRFQAMDGTPWGMGMVDLFGSMQDYIDFADFAALKNMFQSATAKLLINENAISDIDDVTDWRQEIVKVQGGNDLRSALQWFQASPLSGLNIQQYDSKIGLLKDLSGQNAFNRGEGGGGITAATAIMALQEAGSKVTNLIRDALFDVEQDLTELQMELTRQYYDEGRVVRIRAAQNPEGGYEDEQAMLEAQQWQAIRAQQWPDGGEMHGPLQLDVSVKVQKAVNFTTLQQNQLMLELHQLLAASGVPVDPTAIVGLMTFDGKDAFLGAVQGGMMAQVQQLQQQVEQMGAAMQNMQAENQALQQVAAGKTPSTGGLTEPREVRQPAPPKLPQEGAPRERMERRRAEIAQERDNMAR